LHNLLSEFVENQKPNLIVINHNLNGRQLEELIINLKGSWEIVHPSLTSALLTTSW